MKNHSSNGRKNGVDIYYSNRFLITLYRILGKENSKYEKVSLFHHDFSAAIHGVARPARR